jgi:hypothetical protein
MVRFVISYFERFFLSKKRDFADYSELTLPTYYLVVSTVFIARIRRGVYCSNL